MTQQQGTRGGEEMKDDDQKRNTARRVADVVELVGSIASEVEQNAHGYDRSLPGGDPNCSIVPA